MKIADFIDESPVGFVSIKHLENQLEKKALELGIRKIYGDFKGFGSNQTAIITASNKNEVTLSYDIIVGADGAHSTVRKALSIETNCLGHAQGASALIPNTSKDVDISSIIKKGDGFLRKIKVPHASIIFMQLPLKASKDDLQKAIDEQGWDVEAKYMQENKALILTDIEVILQQAKTFSNEKKSAILVGDAAASTSYFQGMGANTAFKTAEIAGLFFKKIQTRDRIAFQDFNKAIEKTTNDMIEDSAFLFKNL